jgi:hypothetical protein
MSEHHDHRDECPFKFATLDVCDCVEKNMLDRIAALEAAHRYIIKTWPDTFAALHSRATLATIKGDKP